MKHCVARYGRAEVEQWYWEVWNEANIGYWRGTPEEFRKLHDFAIAGVRRALPTARVGGPDTAGSGGQFMRDFLEHCLKGLNYATGAKGTLLALSNRYCLTRLHLCTTGDALVCDIARIGLSNSGEFALAVLDYPRLLQRGGVEAVPPVEAPDKDG